LYYAARYDDCIAQFELHRTVNPNDVENAAWHFLCVARSESPERAQSALLPVGPDARVPMRQVYDLFAGAITPDEVMAATNGRPLAVFYAHLYLGLYAEALGDEETALEHIRTAAGHGNGRVGRFDMYTVAAVHLAFLESRP
jgi:lipoprotein NlpI